MNDGLIAIALDALAIAKTLAIVFRHRADGRGLNPALGAIDAVAIHEMTAAVAITAMFPAIRNARMREDAMNFVPRQAVIVDAAMMESAHGREAI